MKSEGVKQKSESVKGKKWEWGDSIPQEDQGEDALIAPSKKREKYKEKRPTEEDNGKWECEAKKVRV